MNGIHEVRGSIPLSSTKRIPIKPAMLKQKPERIRRSLRVGGVALATLLCATAPIESARAAEEPPSISEWASWKELRQSAYSLLFLQVNAATLLQWKRQQAQPPSDRTLEREPVPWARSNVALHRSCIQKRLDEEAQPSDLLDVHSKACFHELWTGRPS